MTALRKAWAALPAALKILEPEPFPEAHWSVLERLRLRFNDREAQTALPLPIARFRADAIAAILSLAQTREEVDTEDLDGVASRDGMAVHARAFSDDVDRIMGVLVPSARYRKGHYAWGRFTVPTPHGLHTDHSAEDPASAGEPICIARVGSLGTLHVDGDYRRFDDATRRMLEALRYWTSVPEGEPDEVLETLVRRGIIRAMPINQVMLMVAGNSGPDTQVTQHLAARPPEGGVHSAFFQRQYRMS